MIDDIAFSLLHALENLPKKRFIPDFSSIMNHIQIMHTNLVEENSIHMTKKQKTGLQNE